LARERKIAPRNDRKSAVPPKEDASSTKIVREWHGREYEVIVRGEKYEYNGKLYRSLSGVARAITNTNWNGNEFFGIRKR